MSLNETPMQRLGNNPAETLPDGVSLRKLQTHNDDRGTLTEIYRDEWRMGPRPVQWNLVRTLANVLRGVHVHTRHFDYLTIVEGQLVLGLRDLRPSSPTHKLSSLLTMTAANMEEIVIPPGVAHGFYFPVLSSHIYGVDIAHDGTDEYGCRWDDPALELDWPCSAPLLSARDETAGMLADMLSGLQLE